MPEFEDDLERLAEDARSAKLAYAADLENEELHDAHRAAAQALSNERQRRRGAVIITPPTTAAGSAVREY